MKLAGAPGPPYSSAANSPKWSFYRYASLRGLARVTSWMMRRAAWVNEVVAAMVMNWN